MREKISLQELMKLKGTECQKHNILTFLALASFYNGQENGGVILYFFYFVKGTAVESRTMFYELDTFCLYHAHESQTIYISI